MNVANNFFATFDQRLADLEADNARLNRELSAILASRRYRYINSLLNHLNIHATRPDEVSDRTLSGAAASSGEARDSACRPASDFAKQNPDAETAEPKQAGASRQVDIINMKFFDFDGKTFMNGGAERYVYDLACLLKAMGKHPRILQVAHQPFAKTYRGVKVVGVPVTHTDWWHFDEASRAFATACAGAELIIASPLELACEITDAPVIGINHGMSLDSPFDFSECVGRDLLSRYQTLFAAIDRSAAAVCVDTNFINWVQTFDYDLRAKLSYIPNYYDPTAFRSHAKDFTQPLKFVFPRRVADYRGADITLAAFTNLLAKYSDIELHIIGQYHSPDNAHAVQALIKQYPRRVFHREIAQAKMPAVYADTHIALIPTKWSEGTSLSCIEAMATNHAVIATTVGGLPNLILDGFNGRLIPPTAVALEATCADLIEHRAEAARLAKNALTVAPLFAKSRWERQWSDLITATIGAK
jgi:glycosyltransferase involved in cell wall biosynthesis